MSLGNATLCIAFCPLGSNDLNGRVVLYKIKLFSNFAFG